jgi:Heavy metal associated domain 2
MRPAAFIIHRLARRMRLRIPDVQGNTERCEQLVESMTHCPGIVSVRANPLTGSLLIEHEDGAGDVIARYGRDLNLFDLDTRSPLAEQPPGAIIQRQLARLDAWIRSETGHRSSLGSVAITALLTGAAWQAARGQLLPTAAQLIWYVLSLSPERTERVFSLREQNGLREGAEVPSHVQ